MIQRYTIVCLTFSLALAGLMTASTAQASRARQLVMGNSDPVGILSDGTHGSFFYDDNLNMFYNPVYVNDFKNWVAMEKTNGLLANTASNTAEGGFATEFLNYRLGMYFNRGDAMNIAPAGASSYSNSLFSGGTAAYTRRANYRPIDLVFGADMGLKWGAGLTYGSHRALGGTSSNDSKDLTLRAGVAIADVEPFAAFKILGSEKVTAAAAGSLTDEVKSSGYLVGFRYHWGEWVPFAALRHDKIAQTKRSIGAPERDVSINSFGGGFGRNTKLAEGTTLNYSWSLFRQAKSGQTVSPITINLEHEFTTWLLARAGFEYRIWDRTGDVTSSDTTFGRIGASIKVGKASLDWGVGGNSTPGASPTQGDVDSSSFDFANGLFTTASLTYAW